MTLILNGTDNSATTPAVTGTDTDTGIYYPTSNQVAIATNGTQAMLVNASQNIGIGTASPATKLELYSSQNANVELIRLNNPDANGLGTQIGFTQGSTTWSQIISEYSSGWRTKIGAGNPAGTAAGDAGYLTFFTNNGSSSYAERMRITSAGLLLINTTTTAYSEQVKITFPGTQAIHCNDSISSSSVNYVYFTKSASLTNVGAIYYNGSVMAYQTTSDYRLKENIAPMTGALAKISALRPVTYTWKDNQKDGEGFIAHELQEYFPDAVSGTKDEVDDNGKPKYQGMDASILIATLTAAIQEQQALITTLTDRITALEAK